MSTKQRTIYFERAVWPEPTASSLETVLQSCLRVRPAAIDTCLSYHAGTAAVCHRRQRDEGLYLHIGTWTPNESMSTIETPAPARESADLSHVPPGQGSDFLDGDAMVLISGDSCLLMPSGFPKQSVTRFLRMFIVESATLGSEALVPNGAIGLRFLPIVAHDYAKLLTDEGVKSIHLDVGQYQETAQVLAEGRPRRTVGDLREQIWTTLKGLTSEQSRREIEKAAHVNAKLTITLDRRRPSLTHEAFVPIARQFVEEDVEDVVVETTQGKRIQRGDLVVKRPVNVSEFAKTVHHDDAWNHMRDYLAELRREGTLEQ